MSPFPMMVLARLQDFAKEMDALNLAEIRIKTVAGEYAEEILSRAPNYDGSPQRERVLSGAYRLLSSGVSAASVLSFVSGDVDCTSMVVEAMEGLSISAARVAESFANTSKTLHPQRDAGDWIFSKQGSRAVRRKNKRNR